MARTRRLDPDARVIYDSKHGHLTPNPPIKLEPHSEDLGNTASWHPQDVNLKISAIPRSVFMPKPKPCLASDSTIEDKVVVDSNDTNDTDDVVDEVPAERVRRPPRKLTRSLTLIAPTNLTSK
ncbi:hypothetical protein ACEPPN_000336 [Leptodophora sp. 'Broadleaf-Isolate-01']